MSLSIAKIHPQGTGMLAYDGRGTPPVSAFRPYSAPVVPPGYFTTTQTRGLISNALAKAVEANELIRLERLLKEGPIASADFGGAVVKACAGHRIQALDLLLSYKFPITNHFYNEALKCSRDSPGEVFFRIFSRYKRRMQPHPYGSILEMPYSSSLGAAAFDKDEEAVELILRQTISDENRGAALVDAVRGLKDPDQKTKDSCAMIVYYLLKSGPIPENARKQAVELAECSNLTECYELLTGIKDIPDKEKEKMANQKKIKADDADTVLVEKDSACLLL